jgi:hypothetical protein
MGDLHAQIKFRDVPFCLAVWAQPLHHKSWQMTKYLTALVFIVPLMAGS